MFKPRNSCVGAVVFLIAVALLASGCDRGKTGSHPRSSTPQPALVWQPAPETLDRLEPYKEVSGYEVRVPKGWRQVPRGDHSSGTLSGMRFQWRGPQRSDGTRPELQMTTQESPPSQDENAAGPAATDVLFDSFLVAMKPLWRVMGREVTSCGGKQSGQVNGLTFTRANILEHTDSGADVQGNMYVGRDGPTIIILFAFDAMSHFDESAKLGSAAIQTFRKKQ